MNESTEIPIYPLPPTPTFPVIAEPSEGDFSAYLPNRLGVVVDETFTVVHVEPGGSADSAGVRVKDRLISVDNIALKENIDEIKARIGEREQLVEGKAEALTVPITIQLEREGRAVEIQALPDITVLPDLPGTPTPVLPPYNYL